MQGSYSITSFFQELQRLTGQMADAVAGIRGEPVCRGGFGPQWLMQFQERHWKVRLCNAGDSGSARCSSLSKAWGNHSMRLQLLEKLVIQHKGEEKPGKL